MARSGGGLVARVLFIRLRGTTDEWVHSDTWRAAQQIPGVSVVIDDEGGEARAFGATASGQVAVYDAGGGLVFRGGITASRGHEGNNDGLDAILSLVRHDRLHISSTHVYGCPLFSKDAMLGAPGEARCQK
ncbi:MAG: hypothetical protein JWP03_1480 [Phycisphaerales bacterium]|nr:hypothetical protein [Phycisphaerales bacterium]